MKTNNHNFFTPQGFLILFSLFFVLSVHGQTPPFFTEKIDCDDCLEVEVPSEIGNSPGCQNSSPFYNSNPFFMINQTSIEKVVGVNFVFIQKNDNSGNFSETDVEHQELINEIISIMNHKMSNLAVSNCGGANNSSKIRYDVNSIYIQDSYLWNNDNDHGAFKCPNRNSWYLRQQAVEIDNDPNIPKGIDIFFTNSASNYDYNVIQNNSDFSGAKYACSLFPTSQFLDEGSYIHMPDVFIKYYWMKNWATQIYNQPWDPIVSGWFVNSAAETILHELGHSLGLFHNYICPAHNIMNDSGNGCSHDYLTDNQLYISHRNLSITNIRRFVREQTELDEALVITGNQLIDFNTRLYRDIIIEDGATLTITCKVLMPAIAKIIVKPGGTLIVDGGIITSALETPWQGIEVWGNSSANQWPDANGKYQQGRVVLDNATIENAVCALNLWEPDNYSKTGGIVNANASLFKNNAKSVHALHFRNFHPINETEVKYNSAFTDCVFEITEDYPGIHTFYKHVDMSHVNGIRFIGCDFTLSPLADGVDKYNMAISSYNSAFSVEARCITAHMGSCDYDRCSFEGFYRGIYAHKSSGSYTFTVNRADFTGNTIGIMVNGVKNQSILFCNFRIGPNYSDDGNCNTSGAPSYGISMIESNGFIIEENDFRKNVGAPQGLYIGIRCKDSESEADVIYRNSFTGLSYGNYADGQNRSDATIDLYGLSFMCNNNQNNAIDFIVAKKNEFDKPMINSSQGLINLEAKNTFSANPLQYGHFRNDGGQVITYFYNTNPPIYYTPRLVVPVFVTAVNNCPSNYGGNDPKPLVFNENQRQEREMDFAANLSNYHSVKLLFDNLEDGGNTQNLKSEIDAAWPKDMWDLRAKLLGLSPYLSEEVLMATADKTDVLPESVLFEILSANPDELKKETLIEYLENKENPLPEYMISILRQLAGGITYKTVLMQDMAKYEAEKVNAVNDLIRSCLNDEETDMNYLRTWYNNLNTLSADYGIVDTYLTEKNYDAAVTMLELIPSTRNLYGETLNEFLEYKNLVQWQIQKYQQGVDIINIDSTDFDLLLAIAQNGTIRASSKAMAILEYGTGNHFNNCLYESIPGSNKNISVENPGKDVGLSISANPNPANSWVAFGYKLPLNVNSGEISVTDMQGRLLASFKVTGNAGQKVWDIRNIQKGVYLYTLKAGNRSKQGKLVIQ